MKTTLDLPDELVREMKIRAACEGKKLKDIAAEIIRHGLEHPMTPLSSGVKRHDRFPIIECEPPIPPAKDLTPAQLAETLIEQEADWNHDITGR